MTSLFAVAESVMSARAGPFWSSMRIPFVRCAAFALLSLVMILPASASPWAEVGDNQLRADIEVLQATGVVEVITIAWPLPWQSLLTDLSHADLTGQPTYVRAA